MALNLQSNFRHATYNDVVTHRMSGESATAKKSLTGQPPCVGLYWTKKDYDPEVSFMLVHYSADFSEHYFGGPLASCGYGVFGYGTRYRAMEEYFVLEKALDDIAAGTKWFEENTSMKKLIFIGNSGGGSLMAAFQARAEKDPSIRGGDAFISLNAHPGRVGFGAGRVPSSPRGTSTMSRGARTLPLHVPAFLPSSRWLGEIRGLIDPAPTPNVLAGLLLLVEWTFSQFPDAIHHAFGFWASARAHGSSLVANA